VPYLFEKKKIPKELDKRRKLSDADKEEIQYRYLKVGGVSQRDLAKEYNVSRRLIVFCIYPERQEKNYKNRVNNGGSKSYYDKDKNREYMQKHRLRKKELNEKGLLEN